MIAVLVINWKRPQDTINCVKSIMGAAQPESEPLHIHVLDNGSADRSKELLSKAFENTPIVNLHCSEANLGFAGGVNLLARQANLSPLDYIILVNNDATIDANTILRLHALAITDPKIAAVGGVIRNYDSPHDIQAWGGGKLNAALLRANHQKKETDTLYYITGALMLIRASAFLSINGFDSQSYFMYWEDVDFCVRLSKAGNRLAVAPEAYLYHRESASLGKKSQVLDNYFNISSFRFAKKHLKPYRIIITIAIADRLARRLLKLELNRIAPIWNALLQFATKG